MTFFQERNKNYTSSTFVKISNLSFITIYHLISIKTRQFSVMPEVNLSCLSVYSRVSNKHTGTFINFWIFFPPVCSYLDQYVYSFLAIHNFRPISAISDICNAYENQIFDSFIVDLDKKRLSTKH